MYFAFKLLIMFSFLTLIAVFGTSFAEIATSTSIADEDSTEIQVDRAVDWLVSQRVDWGWGDSDSPQAVLAISLTRTGNTFERELSTKQLEIYLILQLWRHSSNPALTPAKVAIYSMALSSSCHDPRQFYGHDLIGSLLHHEPESDAEFAICSLAICSSGAHVRKRHLRRLLDIANSKHTVDSLSGVVLALQCIIRDHRNRNLQQYLRKPTLALAHLQQSDGGFGSLHSTAIAMQALGDETEAWNRSAAINWLLTHQGPDGAFFDVPTTAEVILALSDKGLGSIKEVDCEDPVIDPVRPSPEIISLHIPTQPELKPNQSTKNNKTKLSSSLSPSSKQNKPTNATPKPIVVEVERNEDATVCYTLWVGSNITEFYTVNITTTFNSSFYNVMQMAAEKDPHFVFSATEWPNGHYVHTLAGLKEEPMSYHYWLLYRLPSLPDPTNPPGNQLVAPTGVDELIIEDGDFFLFWYKKL